MANKFKDNEKRALVAPGSKPQTEKVVVEPQPVVEEEKTVVPFDVKNIFKPQKPKEPKASAATYYLSIEVQEKIERLAKQQKMNKSKALDTLLNAILE